MRITDDFIADLRAAFAAFGIDQGVERVDERTATAGLLHIAAASGHAPPMFTAFDRIGTTVAEIDAAYPRSVAVLAVEYHLAQAARAEDGRQIALPL